MVRFVTITSGMVLSLAMAIALGGLWAVLALGYITVFTYAMDRLGLVDAPGRVGSEFPSGDGLAVFLALSHFVLLGAGIWGITASTHLDAMDKILIFLALSLFTGQVSNPNAHELIHRAPRALRRLGVAVYASFLFGHHASAHIRVHHQHAATRSDPNSARLGESFFRFAWRAWTGSFIAGYRAEDTLRAGRGLQLYASYLIISAFSLAVAARIGGLDGVLVLIAVSLYAQLQLLMSDYVQHYGLQRAMINGRCEPMGPQHSWNAPHGFSSSLMLNAPRHSDHHTRPSRAYPGLELDRTTMPVLPYSLPVMAVVALFPPVWRRIMDKRARVWAPDRAK